MLPDARQVADPFGLVKLANQRLDEVRRRVQNDTLGHRGRKDDPLYRCRRLLTKADERLNDSGRSKLLGLLAAGDPHGEVRMAWHAKEVLRSIDAAHFALLLPVTIPEEYADVPYVASDFTNFSQPWIHDGSADALFLVSPYWMGYVGLGTAVAVLNGDDVPRINCVPFPVVNPSNVNEDWVQIELIPEGWQAEVG